MKCAEHDTPDRGRRANLWTAAAAIAAALLLGLQWGCRTGANVTPKQGWNERAWGPLVPHHTFPADCALCHLSTTWTELRADFEFDHLKETGFDLVGAHAFASCLRCHNDRGPVRDFLDRGCGGCHVDPHETTLGTACTDCHGQSGWAPQGIVAAHQGTRFPLVGAHVAAACDLCHPAARVGLFEGAPLQCHLCHGDDLQRAIVPDHLALGWVADCQRCHSPRSDWGGMGFSHAIFPLTGAHATTDCLACHVNNVYRGTPRDCFSCHEKDYVAAVDPDHVAGNFPTDCQVCHNTHAWTPADFNHERFFPIEAGKHAGLNCIECHTGANYASYTCTNCHAHPRDMTDQDHEEVKGYSYSSPACFNCHPRGRK